MKVLLVHNFYGSSAPSGENTVFLAERDLLKNRNHEVIEYTRHSDEIRTRGPIGTVHGALATPWNPFTLRNLRQILIKEQPDVMHVHNTFPLLSPAIFHSARNLKIAVVLTLHNYRVFCAAGIPMRNSIPCTECLDRRWALPALKYGCYRHSRLATLPMAMMIELHRRINTWEKHIDAFIALTGFQKEKLAEAGLPRDRLHIKPHFYPEPPDPLPFPEREPKVVFIGRLGAEKGLYLLVDAWKMWGDKAPSLELIGEGPERPGLENRVRDTGMSRKISFQGQLPFSKAQEKLARARLMVLPTLCYEGFPMAVREAFALGVPVAASGLGSLPFLVEDGKNGVLFTPGDSADLYKKIKNLWDNPEKLAEIGRNARIDFEEKYTADVNYDLLMDIYRTAIDVRHRRNKFI
ncbi:glycosyltransferase family 4 protein [Thermodesulfobacteriota bacterium]